MSEIINQIPDRYQKDVSKAVKLLKEAGCNEVFLFGSLVKGSERNGSDIDLAVKGCNPELYYHLIGRLMMELDHPIDLINLDQADEFTKYLLAEGDMVSVH